MRFAKFAAALLSITSLSCALQDSSKNTDIDIVQHNAPAYARDVNPALKLYRRSNRDYYDYEPNPEDEELDERQATIIEPNKNAVVVGVNGCISIHFFTETRCVAAAHVPPDPLWMTRRITDRGCGFAGDEARGAPITKVVIGAPDYSTAMIIVDYVKFWFPGADIRPRMYTLAPGLYYKFTAYKGTTDVVASWYNQ